MAASDDTLALPPAAELPRPRTLLVGTSLATAATLMAFAAMFGIYLHERSSALANGTTWIPSGTIELAPAGMMMMTLFLSVFTMQWAIYSIARDDRTNAIVALGLTGLFGVAVLNQGAYYYRDMGLEIDAAPGANLLIYVITGAHLAWVVAGVLFLALMAFRALAGQYTSRQADGIVAAAIFWDAMVAIFFVIWVLIYIGK